MPKPRIIDEGIVHGIKKRIEFDTGINNKERQNGRRQYHCGC